MKKIVASLLLCLAGAAGATDYSLDVPGSMSSSNPYGPYSDTVTLNVTTEGTYTVSVMGQSYRVIGESGHAGASYAYHNAVMSVTLDGTDLTDTPFQQDPQSCKGVYVCHPWQTDLYVTTLDLTVGQHTLAVEGFSTVNYSHKSHFYVTVQ